MHAMSWRRCWVFFGVSGAFLEVGERRMFFPGLLTRSCRRFKSLRTQHEERVRELANAIADEEHWSAAARAQAARVEDEVRFHVARARTLAACAGWRGRLSKNT